MFLFKNYAQNETGRLLPDLFYLLISVKNK